MKRINDKILLSMIFGNIDNKLVIRKFVDIGDSGVLSYTLRI